MDYAKNNTLFGAVQVDGWNMFGKGYFGICSSCGVTYSWDKNKYGEGMIPEGEHKDEKPKKKIHHVDIGNNIFIYECCFGKLEKIVLERIDKVIPWGIAKMNEEKESLQKKNEETARRANAEMKHRRVLIEKEDVKLRSVLSQTGK